MNYTLSYDFDSVLNCGIIRFNDKRVLMDFEDLFSIINFDKNFIYYTNDKQYPFYLFHNRKISYLEHMFKFDPLNVEYIFKNNDIFDLRKCNITVYHKYHKIIADKYEIIEFQLGHYGENGRDAYIMKNPTWKVKKNGVETILMYCEADGICELCENSMQKIIDYENNVCFGKKITFFYGSNGYICSSVGLLMHQIITACYGNGKGTKHISVDHIDQNPLNNRFDNLRIATRKEQEQNSKGIKDGTKRERKHSAKDLPPGITQNMMRKYVVYYQEWLDKEKTKQREFFKVEKHPKLEKPWTTSKSNAITIFEKLQQANKVVEDLDNDIYPEAQKSELPKYISLITMREKPCLVFEKRIDGNRLNLKMTLPENYDLQEQLEILNEKINAKYGENIL